MRDHLQAATISLAIPLGLVLALALIGHLNNSRWGAAAQPASVCGDETMEQQTRAAMFAALDSAFQEQVKTLYSVWLKDTDDGQPRARAGIDQAIGIYLQAYESVRAWKLTRC